MSLSVEPFAARAAEEAAYHTLTGSTLGFRGAVKTYLGSDAHKRSLHNAFEWFGLKKTDFKGNPIGKMGRLFGFAFLGAAAIEGFQEGGLFGAGKGIAKGLVENYAINRAWYGMGGLPGVTGIAAGAVGTLGFLGGMAAATQGMSFSRYVTQSSVGKYMQGRSKLEIASPVNDQYGNVATMRQRGINAMRQSKITARNALGMEAGRRYMPYFR
jgi:hypothetical protein